MRYMAWALCAVVMWCGMAAAETVPLYKDYVYGMPRADVAKVPGVGACPDTEDPAALCREGESFAGETWTQVFAFFEERLIAIKLVAQGMDNHFMAALNALNNTGDVVVEIKDAAGNVFDAFVEAPLAKDGQIYEQNQIKFAQDAVSTGAITYTYYSKDAFVPGGAPGASDRSDFLVSAPDSIRATELALVSTAYSATVIVRFLAPKLAMRSAAEAWGGL